MGIYIVERPREVTHVLARPVVVLKLPKVMAVLRPGPHAQQDVFAPAAQEFCRLTGAYVDATQ
ncbi:hypothetical protein [Hymenobacter terrenus]|uniref:hypothetical protein n=1 Tax=Hymenobacter terrenus TaxID=1629124 RepID=UPI0012E08933|nr:hypothetical protein [Hymenobacter terrenus]